MEIKDRVIILDEENARRLLNLYGDIKDVDELSQIVNRHMCVVIDEIEEDEKRKDLIRMKSDIVLKDKSGNIINVYVPLPEYLSDSII